VFGEIIVPSFGVCDAMARTRNSALMLQQFKYRLLGGVTVGGFWILRRIDRKRMANFLGWLMRVVGPWLPEHCVGRANLAAAFPDKSPAEIATILTGVWDNLGRVAAEYAHLDRIRVHDPEKLQPGDESDVVLDQASFMRLKRLCDGEKPRLIFATHLANWEVPALAARTLGLTMSILYRRPNIGAVSDLIEAHRERCIGNMVAAGRDAPLRLLRALEAGEHVGMLVDQHTTPGVDVVFFGRPAKANPLLAQLAQLAQFTNLAIHGVRVVRQPDGHHFWVELTDEISPTRDAEGRIDIQGTMQTVTTIVEGWVREHPEQWLWLHRRWR
jgi:Kdo2-lipid IVA lauroyltransferase/acyltransferase